MADDIRIRKPDWEKVKEFAQEQGFELRRNGILLPLGQVADYEYGLILKAAGAQPRTYILNYNNNRVLEGNAINCYTPQMVIRTAELEDKTFVIEQQAAGDFAKDRGIILAFKFKDLGTIDNRIKSIIYQGVFELLPSEIADEFTVRKFEELEEKLEQVHVFNLPESDKIFENIMHEMKNIVEISNEVFIANRYNRIITDRIADLENKLKEKPEDIKDVVREFWPLARQISTKGRIDWSKFENVIQATYADIKEHWHKDLDSLDELFRITSVRPNYSKRYVQEWHKEIVRDHTEYEGIINKSMRLTEITKIAPNFNDAEFLAGLKWIVGKYVEKQKSFDDALQNLEKIATLAKSKSKIKSAVNKGLVEGLENLIAHHLVYDNIKDFRRVLLDAWFDKQMYIEKKPKLAPKTKQKLYKKAIEVGIPRKSVTKLKLLMSYFGDAPNFDMIQDAHKTILLEKYNIVLTDRLAKVTNINPTRELALECLDTYIDRAQFGAADELREWLIRKGILTKDEIGDLEEKSSHAVLRKFDDGNFGEALDIMRVKGYDFLDNDKLRQQVCDYLMSKGSVYDIHAIQQCYPNFTPDIKQNLIQEGYHRLFQTANFAAARDLEKWSEISPTIEVLAAAHDKYIKSGHRDVAKKLARAFMKVIRANWDNPLTADIRQTLAYD